MSDIFGAAGSIASSAISAGAMKDATQMQIDALNKQKQFTFDQLDPSKIGAAATAADKERAQNRLALQGIVDPKLLEERYKAEGAVGAQLDKLTNGTSASDQIGNQAVKEAMAGQGAAGQGKQALIDAALKEINAGASLPPDLQAELVKSGLEKSGNVTHTAGGTGLGGSIIHNLVGSAGLQLRQQRLATASNLLGQAQNLEQSRAQILGTLFPNLNTVAQNNLKASQGVLQQSNTMVPEAGLGGSDIANIWLARVGATNQLAQSAADAAARGATSQAQIWNTGIGNAIGYGTRALPTTSSALDYFKSAAAPAPSVSPTEMSALQQYYG